LNKSTERNLIMTIEWTANDLGFSNYYNAENIPPNTLVEVTIVNVVRREFEEGGGVTVKGVLQFDNGREVVLNKTRWESMVNAFGINPNNWVDKRIFVGRGQTMYSGKQVGCVMIDPITAPRLEGGSAAASPQIERPRLGSGAAERPPGEPAPAEIQPPRGARGRMSVTSGRSNATESALDELAARRPDLAPQIDDEVPF
jgi:hypothetical protein